VNSVFHQHIIRSIQEITLWKTWNSQSSPQNVERIITYKILNIPMTWTVLPISGRNSYILYFYSSSLSILLHQASSITIHLKFWNYTVFYIISFHCSCSYQFFFPDPDEIHSTLPISVLSRPDYLFGLVMVKEPFLTLSTADYHNSFFLIIWIEYNTFSYGTWIVSCLQLSTQRLSIKVRGGFAHVRVMLMLSNLNLSLKKDHNSNPGREVWIQY
jgi:hypothetical protein